MEGSEFQKLLNKRGNKFTLMCGAGVAMAISDDMKNWEDFVDQFARKVKPKTSLTSWVSLGFHPI